MNYSTSVIGKKIRDIIRTQHAESLGLVICSLGTLATLPAPPLDPSLPAVFVAVREVVSDEQTMSGGSSQVQVRYDYDIAYLRNVAENEESYAASIESAEGIAETLMGSRKLEGLALDRAKVMNSGVSKISYDDENTRFFNEDLRLRCDIVIIDFFVTVRAVR